MTPDRLNLDTDNDLEEVSLQDMQKPTEANARESLQRCVSELGTMLWRLSSHTNKVTRYLMMTVVVTRSLVDNLDAECATKWEPGKGPTNPSTSLLARIIDSLENEKVENGDDRESVTSASSENSDFVGGQRRIAGEDVASEFLCDLEDWDDDLY